MKNFIETLKGIGLIVLGHIGAALVIYIIAELSNSFGLTLKEGFGVILLLSLIIIFIKSKEF